MVVLDSLTDLLCYGAAKGDVLGAVKWESAALGRVK